MALSCGPNVVSQNLIFALDAANEKTIAQSGTRTLADNTEVYDLVGKATCVTENGVIHSNIPTFDFAGTDEFIDCGDVQDLGDTFTFNTWVWFDSFSAVSSYNPIIFRDGNTTGNVGLRTDGSGYIEFRQYSGAELRAFQCSTSTWYNISVTVDNLVAKLYVNGDYIDTHTFTVSFVDTGNISLARYNFMPSYLDGRISYAGIYTTALTADEVQQNFRALRGRFGV